MIEYEIFIKMTEKNINTYNKKLLEYCCSISNKITFAVLLDYYGLQEQEIPIAYNDFLNEYNAEDKERKTKFLTDSIYRENLLSKYQSDEKVYEYFKRLKSYDMVTLEELKIDLLKYIGPPINNVPCITPKILPQNSFLESRFTWKSHCTIGGLYKVFYFQINKPILDVLSKVENINDHFIFQNINFLEDPGFYYNDKLKCSICSHENTCVLYLFKEEYEKFKLLEIPYVINRSFHYDNF